MSRSELCDENVVEGLNFYDQLGMMFQMGAFESPE